MAGFPVSALISWTTDAVLSGFRPWTTTVAPWAARALATTRPIPAVAPVTRQICVVNVGGCLGNFDFGGLVSVFSIVVKDVGLARG